MNILSCFLLDPITSNDHSFGCPIIYTDTIHNATWLIDTLTIRDTTKLIIASNGTN